MRNDLKYLNIHKKATHQEYISYISKYQLAFQCCFLSHVLCSFCWISVKIMAREWGFSTIFLPQGWGFRTVFVPGGGELAVSKNSRGLARRGWSGLELTDTLFMASSII